MNKVKLFFLFALVLSFGCQPDAAPEEALMPAEVVQLYQQFVDQNKFKEAIAISTPEEQRRLQDLANIIQEEHQDSTLLNTEFLKLDCQIKQDSATCNCQLRDQYETYEATYNLIQQQGRWLVDAPNEEEIFIDEEIEQVMDSLMNELQE